MRQKSIDYRCVALSTNFTLYFSYLHYYNGVIFLMAQFRAKFCTTVLEDWSMRWNYTTRMHLHY